MKKLLALVLALVMVMGLATVGANAAVYSDAKDIDYTEAVDVMSALGVFDGMDGKFNPKGTLTREQGAKIIAYMILGKKAADSLSTAAAPFDDVDAGRWSAGAIAYCTSEKIIGGVGGNKFNPEGELTGYAFAKMLLVALGYDPTQEGLVGDSWSINTAKLALSAGLKKGLSDLVMGDGITREEACQMAFDTEKATLVEYANNTTVTAGDITFSSTSKATKVETEDDDYRTGANNDNLRQFCEEYADKLTYAAAADGDDFGRPAGAWKLSNTEIGTYADAADYIYSGKVTRGTLYSDLGKSVYKALTADEQPSALEVYVDGVEVEAPAVTAYLVSGSGSSIGAAAGDYDKTDAGDTTEVFVDDDSNVTIVIIHEYVVQATSDYNAKTGKVTLAAPDNATVAVDENNVEFVSEQLDDDDFAITEVKEDDYFIATIANGEIQSIAPAKTLTGKVSTYTSGKNVTIDGTSYSYAGNVDSTDNNNNGKKAAYSIGDNATLVLDANDKIVYVDEYITSNAKFVYIDQAVISGDFNDSVIADAYFTDGTEKTIKVKKAAGMTAAELIDEDQNATLNGLRGWYGYSVDSNDKYTLKETDLADEVEDAENVLIVNGTAKLANGNKRANNSTVFVVNNSTDDEVTVYTGIANAPDVTGDLTAYILMNDAETYVRYVYVEAAKNQIVEASTGSSSLIWLVKKNDTINVSDTKSYTVYDAVVDGEVTKVNVDGDYDDVELFTNVYYKAKTNSDGYITSLTVANGVNKTNVEAKVDMEDSEVSYADGVLTIGDEDIVVNSKTKVYLVILGSVGRDEDGNIDEDGAAVRKALLNDPDLSATSSESTQTSASGLKNLLKGYQVGGVYHVVETSTTDSTASMIFMEINAAAAA